jgi:hypothetical protein
MSVEIHIEELVLRGLSPADAAVVTAALRAHLATLAADGTAPDTARDARTPVHRPRPAPASGPEELGRQAAAAVWAAAGGRAP